MLGALLKKLRKESRISLEGLAANAELSVKAVWKIEQGITVSPRDKTLEALAEALNAPKEILIAAREGAAIPIEARLTFSEDRLYRSLNESPKRSIILEKMAPELIETRPDVTTFIDPLTLLKKTTWVHRAGYIQTTTLEYERVWIDKAIFMPLEASYLTLKAEAREVERLFIVDFVRFQAEPKYRNQVIHVMYRHVLLGLRPRFLMGNVASLMYDDMKISCDAIIICDARLTFVISYEKGANGIYLQTEDKLFNVHVSNVMKQYYASSFDAEKLLCDHPLPQYQKEIAYKEAEDVTTLYKFSPIPGS